MNPDQSDTMTQSGDAKEAPKQGEASAPDDQSLARMLAARGIPPEEIARLLALPRADPLATSGATAAAPADMDRTQIVTPPKFEPKPSLALPEFRDSAPEEVEEAERLLRDAHLARRRGRFQQAFDACLLAVSKVPRDAAALEMLGDILQSLGRVDDAVAAYHRAGEADPTRGSAERKYAELVLMQDRSVASLVRQEEPRNPYLSVMLSALCPGLGQYYNGERAKAAVLVGITLTLLILLLWSPWGLSASASGLSSASSFLLAGLGITYILSLVDANIGARRPHQTRSGWDV